MINNYLYTMRIILTENQYKTLLENQKETNSKPAVHFDNIYGTDLSHRYDFGHDLSSDDVWDVWVECREFNRCEGIVALIHKLPKIFPYYDIKKLDDRQKVEVIMGMASEFNPADIVSFAVHKIYYSNNIEQKRLEKQLPKEVADNIRWVLSQESMEIIRNKFGVNEV